MNYDENRAETQPGGNPPQTNTNNYAYPAHGEPLMPAPRNYPAHAEISPQPAQINPPYGGGMFSAPRAPYPPPATVNPYPPPAAVNPYPQAPAYAYPAPGYYYAPPVDPVTLEKKEVRKTSNRVGLAFVLSMVLVFVITFIVEIVLIASTGDIYAINNFLNDSNFLMIFQIAASVPAFTLPFLLVAKVSGHKIGALMPTDKVKPPLMAALVGLSLACFMIGNTATSLFSNVVSLTGIEPTAAGLPSPNGIIGMALYVLAITVAPALVEEFSSRGVAMGMLRKHGNLFAIFASAMLFGLMHGNIVQAPFAFVGGIGMGIALVASNSIWPCVIAHFLNNLLSVIMETIYSTDEWLANVIFTAVFILILICGLISAAYLAKRRREVFQPAEPRTLLSFGQKMGVFSSAPWMIVAYVMFGITILFSLFGQAMLQSLLGG